MDFVKGMDVSTMIELERLHARYYDGGQENTLLAILKKYGVNMIRVRLWNDPYSEMGESYGAGGNDFPTSLEIARRATQEGMEVLLDFHYSDFWTDPQKQFKPKAWRNLSVEGLERAVYEYTRDTVAAFLENGVNLTMVQVGNELTCGLLWPEGKTPHYDNIARFVNAGIRGVRDGAGQKDIRVMLHLDNGGNNALYRTWFDEFTKRGEDFDLIGLSYYPLWHGKMGQLQANMEDIAKRFDKDLIVVETSAGFSMEDYSAYEKLSPKERKGYASKPPLIETVEYPLTRQGQSDFIRDLIRVIRGIENGRGKGFFWWEPAWIPVPGSGWATPASLRYMNDPGPCGNEWANQALFDYEGNALPALEQIREG